MRTYTHYEDNGHGWIAVKLTELDELGIADKISAYSYLRGHTAYLEEDMDAGTWIAAYEARHGEKPTIVNKYCYGRSHIRSYSGYPSALKSPDYVFDAAGMQAVKDFISA